MSKPVPHGFVFYPREYHLSDNPDESFVTGIDEEGVDRRVYLNPDKRSRSAANEGGAKTIPMLDEFAQTGRRARNPCFADDKNGPESPEGVLLIEQARARPDGHVEARWASVLADSSDSPAPAVGIGGLEVYYHPRVSDEVAGWLSHYRDLLAEPGVDAIKQRADLFNKILDARRIWTVAAMLKPAEALTLEKPNASAIREAIEPFLEKYTREGHYGGVWLRVRRGTEADPVASVAINRQFDYKNQEIQTLDQVWEPFDRYHSRRLLSAAQGQGVVVDVVPVERINSGKLGNEKFKAGWMANADGSVPKLQKLFADRTHYLNPLMDPVKANAQLVAKVAVRRAEIYRGATKGNCLVSTIHAYSAPIGHPLQIGPSGEAEYSLKGRPGKDKDRGGPEP